MHIVAGDDPATEKGPAEEVGNARGWLVLVHLAAFAGIFVPVGQIFGPLLVWLVKRSTSPAVDRHGKAALNFQISMTIYMIAVLAPGLVVIAPLAAELIAIVELIDTEFDPDTTTRLWEHLAIVVEKATDPRSWEHLAIVVSVTAGMMVYGLVMAVMAAARAARGKDPGYHLSIQLLK